MAFPGGGNRVPEENALGLGFTPKDKNPGPIAADFYKPGGGYPSPKEMQRGQAEWAYRQEQTPEGRRRKSIQAQDRRKAMNAEGYVSNVNRKSNIQYPSPQGGPTSNASGYRFTPMEWGRPEPPPIRWDQGSGRPPQHQQPDLSQYQSPGGFKPFAPVGPDNFDEGISGAGFLEWQRQQRPPEVQVPPLGSTMPTMPAGTWRAFAGGARADLNTGTPPANQGVSDARLAARDELLRKRREAQLRRYPNAVFPGSRTAQMMRSLHPFNKRRRDYEFQQALQRKRAERLARQASRPTPDPTPIPEPMDDQVDPTIAESTSEGQNAFNYAQGRPAQSARPNMVNR